MNARLEYQLGYQRSVVSIESDGVFGGLVFDWLLEGGPPGPPLEGLAIGCGLVSRRADAPRSVGPDSLLEYLLVAPLQGACRF